MRDGPNPLYILVHTTLHPPLITSLTNKHSPPPLQNEIVNKFGPDAVYIISYHHFASVLIASPV